MNEIERRVILFEKIRQFAYDLQAERFPKSAEGSCYAHPPAYTVMNYVGDELMKLLEKENG